MHETTRAGQASEEALTQAIAAHELWLDSNGAKGACIRLSDHATKGGKPPRLVGARLDRADARDADISGWHFDNCSLCDAEVDNLRASKAFFHRTSLSRISGKSASFDGATIVRGDMSYAAVENLSMVGARLSRIGLTGLETKKLVADNVRMDGVHGQIKVGGSGVMRNADLQKTNLSLDLSGMDLRGTAVKDSRLVARLADGAKREAGTEGSARLGDEWQGMAAPGHEVRTPVLDSVMRNRSESRAARPVDASREASGVHSSGMHQAAVAGSDGAGLIESKRTGGIFGRLSEKLGAFRDNVVSRARKLSASGREDSIGVREAGPAKTPSVSAAPVTVKPLSATPNAVPGSARGRDALLDGSSGTGRRAIESGLGPGSKSLAVAIAEAQAKLSKPVVAKPAPKRPARRVSHRER